MFGVFQINDVVIGKDKKHKHLPGTAQLLSCASTGDEWHLQSESQTGQGSSLRDTASPGLCKHRDPQAAKPNAN